MQYAVIKTSGKQYKVSEGDILTLDKFNHEDKKNITFEEVLLTVNDSVSFVGKPTVNGAKVSATILEDKKGVKIRVSKFKAKSRYRKTIGFRPQHTIVKIDKINFGSQKTEKKTTKPAKTAPIERKT